MRLAILCQRLVRTRQVARALLCQSSQQTARGRSRTVGRIKRGGMAANPLEAH